QSDKATSTGCAMIMCRCVSSVCCLFLFSISKKQGLQGGKKQWQKQQLTAHAKSVANISKRLRSCAIAQRPSLGGSGLRSISTLARTVGATPTAQQIGPKSTHCAKSMMLRR